MLEVGLLFISDFQLQHPKFLQNIVALKISHGRPEAEVAVFHLNSAFNAKGKFGPHYVTILTSWLLFEIKNPLFFIHNKPPSAYLQTTMANI